MQFIALQTPLNATRNNEKNRKNSRITNAFIYVHKCSRYRYAFYAVYVQSCCLFTCLAWKKVWC